MIVLRNLKDNSLQVVHSIDGYDPAEWSNEGTVPEGGEGGRLFWDGAKVVLDLATFKQELRQAIELKKFAVQASGCMTPKGRVQTDPSSREKIGGAVQLAMLAQASGQPLEIDWTMEDDRDVPHSAADLIAMGIAVGQFISAAHAHSRLLKSDVENCESLQDLNSLNIEAGWPG